MDILVLQHIRCEPPAAYGEALTARGHGLHPVEVDEGEPLPDWREYGAVVAMGGPMGAYEDAEHPWLAAEKRLIHDAVAAGLPYFGACLGVQLLAAALGARVYPGPAPEVGLLEVQLTDAGRRDPVASILPASFTTLQWHGDTFDLPEGAVSLFSSPAYPNQGFRYGEVAYGVQFHLEVDAALADEWSRVPAYREAADRVLGAGGLDGLLDGVRANADRMIPHARTLSDAWLDRAIEFGRA
ncbi:MAG: type 1 glutamine amidotransferase [Actinomycetota bacterium]